MGQCFSRTRPLRAQPYQAGSILMGLPIDILEEIFKALEPDACMAFALVCRGLSDHFFVRARDRFTSAGREYHLAVQHFLEKDIGDRELFCVSCRAFIPFRKDWRAGIPRYSSQDGPGFCNCLFHQMPRDPRETCLGMACRSFGPDILGYQIPFHLARVVMNRHRFGAPRGLPLSCLEADITTNTCQDHLIWKEKWKARIIEDELFLCATHVLRQADQGISAEVLRDTLHQSKCYAVCEHLYTWKRIGLGEFDVVAPLDERHGGPITEKNVFVPCRDVQRSCEVCLTDYTTTIEWKQEAGAGLIQPGNSTTPSPGGWIVTITTYHQLGHCRSAYDWKWQTATSGSAWNLAVKNGFSQQYGQVLALNPFGSVRTIWNQAAEGEGASRATLNTPEIGTEGWPQTQIYIDPIARILGPPPRRARGNKPICVRSNDPQTFGGPLVQKQSSPGRPHAVA